MDECTATKERTESMSSRGAKETWRTVRMGLQRECEQSAGELEEAVCLRLEDKSHCMLSSTEGRKGKA